MNRSETEDTQIAFDFLSTDEMSDKQAIEVASDKNHVNDEEKYLAQDYQLADLLVQLSTQSTQQKSTDDDADDGVDNESIIQTLKERTLEISKQTREGCIALSCTMPQQKDLIASQLVYKLADKKTDKQTDKEVDGRSNFKPLILDNNYLYLRRYWQYQQQLADQIQLRMQQTDSNNKLSSEKLAEKTKRQQQRLAHYFQADTQGDETNWQELAAKQAMNNSFLIISGGPGTGKTTTITRILVLLIEEYLFEKEQAPNKNVKKGGDGYKILLAAPTGKASVRMLDSIRDVQQSMNLSEQVQEYLPSRASTLHKLLGYIPDSVSFRHNRNNPLRADLVLIDEASMIDIALMAKLVEAVPANAKLILIGDKDQLSSVETGSVFADLCRQLQGTPAMVTLQKNWRFSKDSGIGQLAQAANKGDQEAVMRVLNDENQKQCELLSPAILNNKKIPEQLVLAWQAYFNCLQNPQATVDEIFNAFNQYRILCAQRRGLNGSVFISQKIEEMLREKGKLGGIINGLIKCGITVGLL